jgi:hypothetical protein
VPRDLDVRELGAEHGHWHSILMDHTHRRRKGRCGRRTWW